MPLFRIAPPSARIETTGGRGASPSLISQSGPGIVAPQIRVSQAVQAPRPLQVHGAPVFDPWKHVANFAQVVKETAYRKADEKARINASMKVRQTEDELRKVFYGDGKTPGFASLDGADAMNGRDAYFSKLQLVVDDAVANLPPNEKRHALPSIMGFLSNYKNMGASHANTGQERAKQQEQQARYTDLMNRIDDVHLAPEKVMEEIAGWGSTLTNLPEEVRQQQMGKAIGDYADLIRTKDPDVAFPLIMSLQDLADPVLDVDTRTKLNINVSRIVAAKESKRKEVAAQTDTFLKDERERNDRALFNAVHNGEDIDWKQQQRLVAMGRMSMGTFESYKNKAQNRAFIPPTSPFEMSRLKGDILHGMPLEDIQGLELNLQDERALVEYHDTLQTSGRREEIAAAEKYISAVISDNFPKTSRYMNNDLSSIIHNARTDLVTIATDPTNKKPLQIVAQDLIKQYGFDLSQPGNLPSIVVPGGEIHRPQTQEELENAIIDLRDHADDLSPEQEKYYLELIPRLEGEIRTQYFKQRKRELQTQEQRSALED